MRRSIFALVLTAIAFEAWAAPVVYTFEGYFSSEREGADPGTRFPSEFYVGQRFTARMTYDADRMLFDPEEMQYYSAPVIDVSLQTESGEAIIVPPNNTSNSGAIRSGGLETLYLVNSGYLYTSPAGRVEGDIVLRWRSTELGQLPDNVNDRSAIDPGALDPQQWTLLVTNRGECPPWCDDYLVSKLTANITGFWLATEYQGSVYSEQFDADPADWSTTGGTWSSQQGSYRNAANAAFTSSVYTGSELTTSYDLYLSMYSQWSATGNRLGVVLHYTDAANFDEIRLNMQGTVTYNRVRNGTRTTVQTASYTGLSPRQPFAMWLTRDNNFLTVRLGGEEIFNIEVGNQRGGYTGVFASWNLVRIDDFRLMQDHDYRLQGWDFSVHNDGWTPVIGSWTRNNGYYYSSSNLPAAIATAPAFTHNDYTFDTSLYLEWSNTGNRGGIVYDYQDASNYRAVLVSSGTLTSPETTTPGTLEVIEVRNGVSRVVYRSTNVTFIAREWFPIGVRRVGNVTTVNGIDIIQPIVPGTKRVGLLTRYNKVRFDTPLLGLPE